MEFEWDEAKRAAIISARRAWNAEESQYRKIHECGN